MPKPALKPTDCVTSWCAGVELEFELAPEVDAGFAEADFVELCPPGGRDVEDAGIWVELGTPPPMVVCGIPAPTEKVAPPLVQSHVPPTWSPAQQNTLFLQSFR